MSIQSCDDDRWRTGKLKPSPVYEIEGQASKGVPMKACSLPFGNCHKLQPLHSSERSPW